jgi:hypothetical protein
MIPRLAALSIAEMIARISTADAGVERIRFCRLRRRALTLRFRSARLCVWRDRFAADFVLAIAKENFARTGFCREQFLQALVRRKLCLVPGAGKRSSHSHLIYAE